MLTYNLYFSESSGNVTWQGKRATHRSEFNDYLCGSVRSRVIDQGNRAQLYAELSALATTGLAVDTLKQVLSAPEPERKPWEVGEALAECLLEEEHGVKWPWNTERDKRTPKASLPGADLIGFIVTNNQTLLLLGEVKTSNDAANPPQVMSGRSGMVHQLDELANSPQIHGCLLSWLYSRCKNTALWSSFQEAVRKYLETGGRALMLFGLLMRDTEPHELDLKNRAMALSESVLAPTKVELNAWYFPSLIADWPSLLIGGNS